MNTKTLIKNSSRAGRFKKKLVGLETLKLEAPAVKAGLLPLLELHRQKTITDAEFCASYVLLYLSKRFPKTWAGARRPDLGIPHEMRFPVRSLPMVFEENILRRLPETLGEVFNQLALKSTPETVNRALLHWSTMTYPLILLLHIPHPKEVLEQQKNGRRCVTVTTENLDRFVLGERDPLSFAMHDLIHADHFYHDNLCYEGQISLYWFLDHCLSEGHFTELLGNPDFKFELEYLISDMNAYAIHSLKCLKSALLHYHPTKEEYFREWAQISGLPEDLLLLLGTPAYSDVAHDHILLSSMKSFRR